MAFARLTIDDTVQIPVPTQCELCDSEEEVNSYCRNCAQKLCDLCKKTHLRITTTRDHVIVHVSEGPCLSDEPTICQEHRNALSFYCRTCSSLSCSQCWPLYHNGHSFTETETYAREVKDKLLSIISNREKECIANTQNLQTIEKAQTEYVKEMDESKHKVKQTAKGMIDQIRNVEKEQLSEIDKKMSAGLAVFDKEKMRITSEDSQLKDSIQKLKTHSTAKDSVLLIRSANELQKETENRGSTLSLVVPVVNVVEAKMEEFDWRHKMCQLQTRDRDYSTGKMIKESSKHRILCECDSCGRGEVSTVTEFEQVSYEKYCLFYGQQYTIRKLDPNERFEQYICQFCGWRIICARYFRKHKKKLRLRRCGNCENPIVHEKYLS